MIPPSYTSLPDRFWSKVDEPNENGCWLWTGALSTAGYGRFHLDDSLHQSHRVSAADYYGPIPDGKLALHHCDIKPCVRPEHLYYGTQKENVADAMRRNRHVLSRAFLYGKAKLTEESVVAIRREYAGGIYNQAELAARYGVVHQTISDVIHRTTWRLSGGPTHSRRYITNPDASAAVFVCKKGDHRANPSTLEIVTPEYCLISCKICGLTAEVTFEWRGKHD